MHVMLLLAQSVWAQDYINPDASVKCKTDISNSGLSSAVDACGGSPAAQVFADNPLEGLVGIGSSKLIGSYCSDNCRSSFASSTNKIESCKNEPIFKGSTSTGAQAFQQFEMSTGVLCIKSTSDYCATEVFNNLISSGLNPSNGESYFNAYLSYAKDPKKSCTTCARLVTEHLTKNPATFGANNTVYVKTVADQLTLNCKDKEKSSGLQAASFTAFIAIFLL